MTHEDKRIATLMLRNEALRRLLVEIYAGRWRDAVPQDLREAVGRVLLPGREG